VLTQIIGGAKQKGIVYYGVSANRQNPFAGAGHDAIFNVFRRTKNQIFFWLPPLVAGYYVVQWANERYVLCLLRASICQLAFVQ
jgi:ubiquinol-cytochrome c reductase subunit 8